MFRRLLFCLLFTLSTKCLAAALTEQQKLNDFHQLLSLVEAQYGPKLYKKDQLGLDLPTLTKEYEELIKKTTTNGEFYYMMVRFVAEFKDGHFSVIVPSSKVSTLGFSVDLIDGKVLIEEVNPLLLPSFDFERGDEIVTFNGLPVMEEVNRLKPFVSNGNESTITRVAAISVPTRRAARLPSPSGIVELGIRHGTTDNIETIRVKWFELGESLDEQDGFWKLKNFRFPIETNYSEISSRDLMGEIATPDLKTFRCSGATRTAIPDGAVILTKEPFVSYYHPTPKGNIGYLRIPHYSFEANGVELNENVFSQYVYVINQLEKNTVGLVIDQDHNCGGSVELVEKMASLFIPKVFPGLEFQLLANKTEYLEFRSWLEATPENTFARQGTEEALSSILGSWKKGEYLTPKTTLHGSVMIHPHVFQYTKPIVLLADEMSGSGGDAFPGLMQGHGRAKVIGTRTMGLGGHVVQVPGLYNSGLSLRMTKSLFYRPDGSPIENNGVNPDVVYSPGREDFVNQYRAYQAFYLNELFKLIDEKAVANSEKTMANTENSVVAP